MRERNGGLWADSEGAAGATPILDFYDAELDCILVISKRVDGKFQPWLYKKAKQDHQWSLPWWVPVNDKAILDSEEEAAAYLERVKQDA